MSDLVSVEWLADHLYDSDVRVVDVRWYLKDQPRSGWAAYQEAHIPNAVFMNIDGELAMPPYQGPGRHPLPTPERFQETMERAGVSGETLVVAYDDSGGGTAARLWWLLRYFGHERAALLDGGINEWVRQGRPLTTAVPTFPRGQFTPRPQPGFFVTKQEVIAAQMNPRILILDARAAERYRGEVEPIDPRAGHIPGAVSAPAKDNLRGGDDFRFADPTELRARYEALGANKADRIIAYCGSGVTAAQTILALCLAGYNSALLYEGSWSDWSSDPTLPAATGDAPPSER